MKFSRMTEIQEDLFQTIRTTRASKGMEYATEEDTLADFKEVAAETGVDPVRVWSVYVKKHLRAVDSFVRSGDVLSESIESRILDVIVYHILLLGLIEDLDPRQNVEEEGEEPSHNVEWTGSSLLGVDYAAGPPMADLGADAVETDGQMLARLGTDGQRWANEFMDVAAVGGRVEMGTLISWFANAIEAGRNAGMAGRDAVERARS